MEDSTWQATTHLVGDQGLSDWRSQRVIST